MSSWSDFQKRMLELPVKTMTPLGGGQRRSSFSNWRIARSQMVGSAPPQEQQERQ
jgi:hypothetical protein